MTFTARCHKCGATYPVCMDKLMSKQISIADDSGLNILTVLYTVCPECKLKQVAQIDNPETLMLLEKLKKLMGKFRTPGLRSTKLREVNNKLDAKRAFLETKYLDRVTQLLN